MSHFTVAVATKKNSIDEVEKLLAPYDENIEVEPYLDEDGDETTYNPNSKWDWYQIGGRWNNSLVVDRNNDDVYDEREFLVPDNGDEVKGHPELKKVNGAKIKDIKFDLINGGCEKAIREWELFVEEQEPQTPEEEDLVEWNMYTPQYYINQYGTKEEYVRQSTMFSTWAFLNEQGWCEQGSMGWWSMNDATKDSRIAYIDKLNEYIKSPEHQEEYLFIVDCHI